MDQSKDLTLAEDDQFKDDLTQFKVGRVIANQYEVVRYLGYGSMGIVYLCRDRALDQLIALKVLNASFSKRDELLRRFKNEVLSLFAINSPHVVRISGFIDESPLTAYTMEFVPEGSLSEIIRSVQAIEIGDVVHYIRQMALGLKAIHGASILHRDLKPSNILIDSKGRLKISDLGIARSMHEQDLSETGGFIGTINYQCPEYLRQNQFTAASDIYALGIIAYELITRLNPIKSDTFVEALQRCEAPKPIIPPSQLNSDCPTELSRIVLKALSFDPERRYSSAAELLKDITPLAAQYPFSESAPIKIAKLQCPTVTTAHSDRTAMTDDIVRISSLAGLDFGDEPSRIESSINLKKLAETEKSKSGKLRISCRYILNFGPLLFLRARRRLSRPEKFSPA